MKNLDNKYNTPMHNPERTFIGVTKMNSKSVLDTPKLSWNTKDATSSHTRNWRWSESPEIELKACKEPENRTHNDTESKTVQAKQKLNTHTACKSPSPISSKSSTSERSLRKKSSSKKYKSHIQLDDKSPKRHKSKTSKYLLEENKIRKSKKYD